MPKAPRDKKGRFIPGVSPNPAGRKPRPVEVGVLELFRECVSMDDRRDIIAAAVVRAKRGDKGARDFIYSYLYGPPVQKTETAITGGVSLDVMLAALSKVYGDAVKDPGGAGE